MISKDHKKHADIARPSLGFLGRNEWAFVGGQCSDIKSLADKIINGLTPTYKCIYADAKHAKKNEEIILPENFTKDIFAAYTNYQYYHQFNFSKSFTQFQFRQAFGEADLILVNGNHFEAKSQIVIIDENKRASLQKRIAQLTNVELILLAGNAGEIFDFIKEKISSINQIPVYKLSDTEKVIDFFKNKMQQAKPLLNGLVLAGGKSVRMGFDKALINWHGKEQQYYLADLLSQICDDIFISCTRDRNIDFSYKKIEDTFMDLGPFGAILSAFRENPDAAWLVVACDLPLLDLSTLNYLKEYRNVSSMATSFESPYNHFPEPLIAIWEPKSYPALLSFLSQGYNCPGKALRNMDVTVLKIRNPGKLTNVNTKEDMEKVKQQLQNTLQENNAQ